jgi:hypothetical protein
VFGGITQADLAAFTLVAALGFTVIWAVADLPADLVLLHGKIRSRSHAAELART